MDFSRKSHLKKYLQALFFFSVLTRTAQLSGTAYTVNSLADTNTGVGTAGTLRYCIIQANTSGGGGSTITFAVPGTITLTSSLPFIGPVISSIDTAGNAVTIDGGGLYQAFFVNPTPNNGGTPTLALSNNLTFLNTASLGGNGGSGGNGGGGALGAGGGLFIGNSAHVTLTGIQFTGCSAQGGAGGNGTSANGGGGGGGMNGGPGASGSSGGNSNVLGGGGGGGGYGSNSFGGDGNSGGGGGGGWWQSAGVTVHGGAGSALVPGGGGGGGSDENPGGAAVGAGGGAAGVGIIQNGGIGGGGGAGGGGSGTPTLFGGGGGGGATTGNGGNGGGYSPGFGGGGGGGATNSPQTGGQGGVGGNFAGGGGAGIAATGGSGGFGGGGGGAGYGGTGGGSISQFGGGGGGGYTQGAVGFGSGLGGTGGHTGNGGGGGAGLGGAIFISTNAILDIFDITLTGNSITAGSGGTATTPGGPGGIGSALSPDIFMMSGGTINFFNTSPISIPTSINSNQVSGLNGGITVNAPGTTVTLGGNNTYTGFTTLIAGTLQVSSDTPVHSNLGNTTAQIAPPVLFQGGTLEFTGTTSSSRNYQINAPTKIIVDAGAIATLSGVISSTGGASLEVSGLGTLDIAAFGQANTFSCPITIDAGATLEFDTQNSLPASISTITDNGTLAFGPTQGTTLVTGISITGSGNLAMVGGGTTELTGTNTYTGSTSIIVAPVTGFAAGTLQIDSPSALPSGTNILNNGTLAYNHPAGSAIISGNITTTLQPGTVATPATGALVVSGAGTLELSGTNTFLGLVTITSGTLQIDNSFSFPATNTQGVVLGDSSTFLFVNTSGVAIVDGVISDATGVATPGTINIAGNGGTVAFEDINTYTGPTVIGVGATLRIDDAIETGALPNPLNSGLPQASTVTNHGTLAFNNPAGTQAVVTNNIGGAGTLVMEGLGTVEFSGNNSTQVGLTITSGTVQVDTLNSIPSGTISNDGAMNFNFSAPSSVGNLLTGTGTFNLVNTGPLTLTNPGNNYTGGTGISGGGTIIVSANNHLGAPTAPIIFNNGTLQITLPITITRDFIFQGPGSGTLDIGANPVTMSGNMSGIGPFIITGTSSLDLTGNNTNTGSTTISAGITLNIDTNVSFPSNNTAAVINNGAFVFNFPTGDAFVQGPISGTGFLTMQGGGTLHLGGAAGGNTYTGNTTISSGILEIDAHNALTPFGNIIDNSVLQFNNTGTATVPNLISGTGLINVINTGTFAPTNNANSYQGGTFVSGGGTVSITNTGQLGLATTAVSLNNGTLDFPVGVLALTFNRPIPLGGPGGTISVDDPSGIVTDLNNITGTGPFVKTGPGTLILEGTNSYTNGTLISQGTLQLNGAGSLPAGPITDNANFTLNPTGTLTVPNQITGSGFVNVIGGTVFLSFVGNSYSGGTNVTTGGTLQTTNDAQLGGNTAVLTLNNGTLDVPLGTTAFQSPRAISLAGPGIFSIDDPAATAIFSGPVTGSGTLTKNGPGILALSGTNSYTGLTTINAGTFRIDSPNSFPSANSIQNNSALVFNQGGVMTISGSINGPGSLTTTGFGTVILSGVNGYTGPTTLSMGTLQINGPSSLPAATVVTDNANLAFGNSVLVVVPNSISGTGTLTMVGTGTVELSGNNSGLTGITTISSGTIQIDNANSLPPNTVRDNGNLNFNLTGVNTIANMITGTGTVNLINSGTVILSNAFNSYSGGTGISGGGTIQVTTDTQLGANTGPLTLNNGTLEIAGTTAYTTNRLVNLAGPGTIQVDAASEIATFTNIISGANSLTVQGLGTVALSGKNTFSGPAIINSGTLQINTISSLPAGINITDNGNLAFAYNSPGIATVSGTITGTGTLTVNGTGKTILSGNNSGFTGSVAILTSTGQLQADSANSLAAVTSILDNGILTYNFPAATVTVGALISGTGSVNLTNTGTLILSNAGNTYSGGTGISGGGTIQWSNNGQLGAPTGPITFNVGTLDYTASVVSARPIFLNGPATLALNGNNGTLSGNITGVGSLTKTGTGTLTLSGNNDYTGATTIAAGTLLINGPNSFPPNSNVTDNGSFVFNNAGVANVAGSITGTGTFTMQGTGTVILSGTNSFAGPLTISSGTVQINEAGSLPAGINVTDNGTLAFSHAGTLTVGGLISGSGSVAMFNSGRLILSNAGNSYSGGTLISDNGIIQWSVDSQLGTGGVTYNSGTLDVPVGVLALSSARSFLLAGPGIVSVDDPAGVVTLSGPISGPSSLQKAGPGTLIISGASNTYMGDTTVSGGTLEVTSVNGIPLDGNVVNNGALVFNLTGTSTQAGNISGSGPMTKLGAGTLILSGANTYSGQTTISAGILQINSESGLPSVPPFPNVINNASVVFNNPIDSTAVISNNFVGTGTITMTGAGTLELAGNNSGLTGITTIFPGGTIQIDNAISLPPNTVVDNGSLNFSMTVFGTVPNLITGTGSVNMINTGTLFLSNANTYSGGTGIFGGGTIQVSNDNQLGNPAGMITFNNGTLNVVSPLASARPVLFNGPGTINTNANAVTFSGNMSGGGSLSKLGTGTLTLSGNNTFIGPLTISAGTVDIATNVSLPSSCNVVDNALLAFTHSGVLFLSGAISGTGAVSMNNGLGELILGGVNTFAGPLTISAGTVEIATNLSLPSGTNVVDNGSLVFTHSGTINYTGSISGSGSLTMDGTGVLSLQGVNTYTGPTSVVMGNLNVDGSVVSPITVFPGGILSGTGTVGNVFISGEVAPGNSIGTITGSNFVFNSGSVYAVEFSNTASDLTKATSTVTINGGQLLLVPDNVTAPAASYTIITSPSITVNSPFTIENPSARFPFTIVYSPTTVRLVLSGVGPVPFPIIVPKGNAGAVAKCYQLLALQGNADLIPINNILDIATGSEIEHMFNQMQPSNFNNIAFSQQNVAERIRQVYTTHFFENLAIACKRPKGFYVWMTPFAERVRQHGKKDRQGYQEGFAGFNMAVDYQMKKQWMFTSGFSYAHTDMNVPHGRTHAHYSTYAGSLGASWTPGRWFSDLQVAYLFSPVHARRKMHFTTPRTYNVVNLNAKHTQYTNQGLAHFGMGYLFKMKPHEKNSGNIYPFANVDYQYVPQESFREHGAGSLNLRVRSKHYEYLRSEGGFGFGYKRCSEKLEASFDVTASYIRETRFNGKQTRSKFAPLTTCTINTHGLSPQNNLISPTATLRIAMPSNAFSWTVGYHGEYGSHFSMSAGEMEFRMDF